jgi:hypothetical protein
VGTNAVFASEHARVLLARHNLAELDAIFEQATDARLRHSGRSVWDTHLHDEDGKRIHVYVKMNWGRRRLWPRMTDLKTGQWLQSLPVREWHGIGTLGQLGINVPQRLAVIHRGLVTFQSAVIVRAIPPSDSVFDLLQSGKWSQFASDCRQHVLRGIARVMRTIHTAGLGWRGTSVGHFYPQATANDDWNTWVIDCEGVHRSATQQTFDRDDRKLIKSFELAGADEETRTMLTDCLRQQHPTTVSRAA